MKKIITWMLLAAMLLGMFAGCGKSTDPTQSSTAPVETTEAPVGENNAAEVTAYLEAIYKDSGAKTAGNFERFGIVRIAGVPYEVVWTVDVSEDLVKIIVNDDGTVTIDVNEKCTEDTVYTLTATVTDPNGNTSTASWEYLLPGVASVEEMQAIVDQAYALNKGESMSEEVTLYGVITSIDTVYSEQYKNITVTIAVEGREDKPIMCYRLKGEGTESLIVGDTITVQGTLTNYNGTIEFDSGCVLTAVEKTGVAVEVPSDPHQIMEDVYALDRNESLPYGPVTLTGSIISIDDEYSEKYKNITVTIRIDWYTIKCYRLKGEGAEDLAMNDIITVKGNIKNYNGTREFEYPELLNVVKVGGYPQPSDPVEIVTAAYNLDAGWTLPYCPAVLTGTVTKVNTSWSDDYENVTVTMVVPGAENMPIKCYRMTYGNDIVKKTIPYIMVGDTITVEGPIINYQSMTTGKCEIEYNYPELIDHVSLAGPFPEKEVAVEDGTYIIWSADANMAMKALTKAYGYPYGASVSQRSTGELVCDDASAVTYTITKTSGNKFTIQDANGKYLGLSGTYNSFTVYDSISAAKAAEAAYEFVLMQDEDGNQLLMNAGKKKFLQYSTSYSSFGCYGWPNADTIVLTPADKVVAPSYVKVTSASEVTAAKYVMVVSSGDAPVVFDGGYLTSAHPTISGDVVTDAMGAVWTVSIDGNQVVLTDSNGVTIGPRGGNNNGVSNNSEYVWELVVNTDGTVSFKGVGSDAVALAQNPTDASKRFRGFKTTTISSQSYPSVFTLYKLEGSEFDFEIQETPEEPVVPTGLQATLTTAADLKTGDKIVIAAPSAKKALSSTNSGFYPQGVDVQYSENIVFGFAETEILTVTVNDDGTYSFSYGENYLAMGDSYNSTPFGTNPNNKWNVTEVSSGVYNVINSVRGNYLRMSSYGTWDTVAADKMISSDVVTVSFYKYASGSSGSDSTSAVADGQYVIWAASSNKAITALTSNYGYASAVDVALKDGKLECASDAALFTFVNNSDGTVTIKDVNGKYMYQSGTYNNFNVDTTKPAEGADWILEDAGNGSWYIKNVAKSKYIGYSTGDGSWGSYSDKSSYDSALTLTPASNVVKPSTEGGEAGGTGGDSSTTTGAYTKIDKVANLTAGTYYMAAYLTKDSNSKDLSAAPYHLWSGGTNGSQCYTTAYAFDGDLTTTATSYLAKEMQLVAVSGKTNTYYIMQDGKYLYTTAAENNKLSMGTDPVEWVAQDNSNGGITFVTTYDGTDIHLGTGSATKNFIRSYKNLSTLKYGVCFFKAN